MSKSASTVGPDVKELREQKLPQSAFPGRGGETLRIFVAPDIHKQILAHGMENTSVEICGVMVGRWQQDDEGPFVTISAAIPGEAAANKHAEVTFTHETWARINKRMDAEFADDRIVGWYHTHPGFGVFLSDRDRFIHEHFFSAPGQIAYVVDPIRREEGMFVWSEGKPTPATHYWIGKTLQHGATEDGKSRRDRSDDMGARSAAAAMSDPTAPRGADYPPDREHWSQRLLFGICVFALGYLLATLYASWNRERMVETAVTHYAITKGVRPGLGPQLDAVQQVVGMIRSHLLANANAVQRGATTMPSQTYSLEQLAELLSRTQMMVGSLREQYGLSPEDEMIATRLSLRDLVQLPPEPAKDATTQPSEVPAQGAPVPVAAAVPEQAQSTTKPTTAPVVPATQQAN